MVPRTGLLIQPYLLREALASTRIEGTRTTLGEVFAADAGAERPDADVEEVVNYAAAMRWGLERLEQLPLSVRLLCEMHRRLMAGVRGRELSPGEIRRTQNWIGPPGSALDSAQFVPPPAAELPALLADWERFANEESELPLLVQNALLHLQFETIHPFLDGNGRLGRLLLVFFLIVRGRLAAPLLYLSTYLEAHREEYYEALQMTRDDDDAIAWIELFSMAIYTQAHDAVERALAIIELRERYRESAARIGSPNALAAIDLICENPIVTTRSLENRLGISRPTALRLLTRLAEQDILSQVDPGARGQRRYVAREMMDALGGGSRD
jgi:Fic family protein